MKKLLSKIRSIRGIKEVEVGNGTGFWVGKTRVIKFMEAIDDRIILPTLKKYPKLMRAFETEPKGRKEVIYVDIKHSRKIIMFVESEIKRLSTRTVAEPQNKINKEEEKAQRLKEIIKIREEKYEGR